MVKLQIVQDVDKSIAVMHNVGMWMENNYLDSTIWWKPEHMNRIFLLKHTEPNEYYVALIAGRPAASMVLQETERNQSWRSVDRDKPKKSLYLHWLCVHKNFSGQGYSQLMVKFAKDEAIRRGFHLLRLDTHADENKLCSLYEKMGFRLMGKEKEKDSYTAFYQMKV